MDSLPKIVVVSGLPRSGTSLVMQMLAAGGAPLLVDDVRAANADNPRGYFEYEPVKRIRSDTSWLSLATGKAIKIVSLLLEYLPEGFDYRIVLIERDLSETLASQRALLAREGKQGATLSENELRATFERLQSRVDQLLSERQDFTVLPIEHRCLVNDPLADSRRLAQFVAPVWPNISLDEAAIAAVVDPRLNRQRSGG